VRGRLVAFAVVLAVLLTAACNRKEPASAELDPRKAGNTAETAAEPSTLNIELAVDPQQPKPNTPAKFVATITDLQGKPIEGADVKASLTMKQMDMGKNEVTLANKGAGRYEGEGQFTMAGDWEVTVLAQHHDHRGRKTFPAKSVLPPPQ